MVRKSDSCEITAMLHISFKCVEHENGKHQCIILCDGKRVYRDDEIVQDFSLTADGKRYISEHKTLYFEKALHSICGQMRKDYYLKSSFTCQYSEYSPYGCDDYGTMLCYCRYKEECLKVWNKDDYFRYLEDKDFVSRQETYLCQEYVERNQASGYRGFVGEGEVWCG